MKSFKFRLQTLLDRRKSLEEQLLAQLGEIRQEEANEIKKLNSLFEQLDLTWKRSEEALRNNSPVADLYALDEYAKTTQDDIKLQQLTLDAVRERVESKRQEVVKAMQERQVLEALKEKQEQEYLALIARAEQNELDEMASVRYARGM